MGASESRLQEQLLQAILIGKEGQVAQFLQDYPDYVNTGLCSGRTNPMCRSAYLGRKNIIMLLLKHGANINITSDDGRSALMWAAYRNNDNLMEYLIEQGAKLDVEDKQGANALDLAIGRVNYEAAYLLYTKGMKPKDKEWYKNLTCYVNFDFELMLEKFEEGVTTCDRRVFFERIRKELEEWYKKDLVVDTRESWGEMMSRIKNFEDPPLIPREELPEDFQPHKSFYGKMSCFMNGIDPYPPEDDRGPEYANDNRIAPVAVNDKEEEVEGEVEQLDEQQEEAKENQSIVDVDRDRRDPGYDRSSVPLSGKKSAHTINDDGENPFGDTDRNLQMESIRLDDRDNEIEMQEKIVEVEQDKPDTNQGNEDMV